MMHFAMSQSIIIHLAWLIRLRSRAHLPILMRDFHLGQPHAWVRISVYRESVLQACFDAVEQWEYRIDNAAEMYNIYKANIENMLALYLGLMLILVILAVMTIITITKLYFISHKIEFAVKYCLGDNFVQFLLMPLRINFTILLVSSICSWLISLIFKLNISKDLIFGSLIIMLIGFISLYVLYLNFIRKK